MSYKMGSCGKVLENKVFIEL